jgi:hypothetical protein
MQCNVYKYWYIRFQRDSIGIRVLMGRNGHRNTTRVFHNAAIFHLKQTRVTHVRFALSCRCDDWRFPA